MGTSEAENTQLRSRNATLNDSTTARQHDSTTARQARDLFSER